MKIFIAGDFSPRLRTKQCIDSHNENLLLQDFQPILSASDYSIVNFECAVGQQAWAIPKIGSTLSCEENVVRFLKHIGFDAVTLANNHFFDLGQQGIEQSFATFEKYGLDYVGAGKTRHEASAVLYKDFIDQGKVAIINACEHEFSIANELHGGCNPMDIIELSKTINIAKSKSDYVIVILHGGVEHWQLPTPEMQKKYRFFIDCGADIIINHHQHCYSGYEIYNDKYIFYGLGNFCFDILKASKTWYEGYALTLNLENGVITPTLLPYTQNKEKAGVSLMVDRTEFDARLDELNNIISSPERLYHEFKIYTETRKPLIFFTPYKNRILRSLYIRNLFPSFLSSMRHMELLNFTQCEAHYEVLQQYLTTFYNSTIYGKK